MPVNTAFSIRTPLQGELIDFLKRTGFDCQYHTEFVRDLVCLLSHYQEENVPLFPEVFVLAAPEILSSLAPGTSRIPIGRLQLGDFAASSVLKNCASVAQGGWAIYVCKINGIEKPPTIEFGIFRALKHTYSTSAEDAMIAMKDASPILLVRNRGARIVEILNASNDITTISFTSAQPQQSKFADHVTAFCDVLCDDIAPERKTRFRPYLTRLMLDIVQQSHGTILAVHSRTELDGFPNAFADGVRLLPPIDFASAHEAAVTARDAESLATLQSLEAVLRGATRSDGVVAFSTRAELLAYRIFVKPSDAEKLTANHKGGGRRRTFELLKGRLDLQFRAVLFRSQDGDTECART